MSGPSISVRVSRRDGSAFQSNDKAPFSAEPAYMIAGGEAIRLDCDDWSAGSWLHAEIACTGKHFAMLNVRLFARGEQTPRFWFGIGFMPDLPCRFGFDFKYLDAQRVFFERTPGMLKATSFGRRLEPAEISHVEIELFKADEPVTATFGPFLVSADEPDWPLADAKVVDELGQWKQRDWPGKTHSPAEMVSRFSRELAAAAPAARPGLSRFGGSNEHRFEATGFFRCHNDGQRWWLVDGDGCGFWSAGLDCVRPGISTAIVPGTEKLFDWLPKDRPGFEDAWGRHARWGYPIADFGVANLIRAFGGGWRDAWETMTSRRLRQWGFNTIANWSDMGYARMAKMPYVMPMPAYPTTAVKLFRDLPDVFDPAFETAAAGYAAYLEDFRGDPYLIGYFLANEPAWGFGSFNLAAEMLEANPGTHTRKALAEFLADRYGGDNAAFAAAWNLPGKRIQSVVEERLHRVGDGSKQAHQDCWDFSARIVQRFVGVPSRACRSVDSEHLNLGLRYAWIASDLFYAAAEFFDVFSINCYEMQPDCRVIDEIAARTAKPVMIGEFHFGALDRGLPGTGLRGVADQAQRGLAYRYYVEQAAANPQVVGTHYFTLDDEAALGRFDGENWQIGLVDVCGLPYAEIISAAVATHSRLYDVVAGKVVPWAQKAVETAKIAN